MNSCFCHDCAEYFALLPIAPTGKLVATQYQRDRFARHLALSSRSSALGVWPTTSTAAYAECVREGRLIGFVEFEGTRPRAIVSATTSKTGMHFSFGVAQQPTDAVKEILSTSASHAHAFPVCSSWYACASCVRCGRSILK